MSKEDYHTSTVDGARAWAERHAEPDYSAEDGDMDVDDTELRKDKERIADNIRCLLGDLEDLGDYDEAQSVMDALDKHYG